MKAFLAAQLHFSSWIGPDNNVKAEPIAREVLAARRRVSGAGTPDTIESMGILASVLRQFQQFDEAQQLAEQAVALADRHFGPTHTVALHARHTLWSGPVGPRRPGIRPSLCFAGSS